MKRLRMERDFFFLMNCVFFQYYLMIFYAERRRNCKTVFHYVKLVAGMRDSRIMSNNHRDV
jgi:hypothetical protein